MKNRFPGHYALTPAAMKRLWAEALFVFDASALLNIYSFSTVARNDLMGVLRGLGDSLWMPYQFALEYQRNRRKVIYEQIGIYGAVQKTLAHAEEQFSVKAKEFAEKERFVRVEVQEALAPIFEGRRTALEEHRGGHGKLLANDKYHEEITKLFAGRVGPPPSHDELVIMMRVAKERFELFIPPGWADLGELRDGRWRKKSDPKMHPFGDYFGWRQLKPGFRIRGETRSFLAGGASSTAGAGGVGVALVGSCGHRPLSPAREGGCSLSWRGRQSRRRLDFGGTRSVHRRPERRRRPGMLISAA